MTAPLPGTRSPPADPLQDLLLSAGAHAMADSSFFGQIILFSNRPGTPDLTPRIEWNIQNDDISSHARARLQRAAHEVLSALEWPLTPDDLPNLCAAHPRYRCRLHINLNAFNADGATVLYADARGVLDDYALNLCNQLLDKYSSWPCHLIGALQSSFLLPAWYTSPHDTACLNLSAMVDTLRAIDAAACQPERHAEHFELYIEGGMVPARLFFFDPQYGTAGDLVDTAAHLAVCLNMTPVCLNWISHEHAGSHTVPRSDVHRIDNGL